jgi:glycosyltransferase involved in cell wall biosynthesis
VTSHTWLVLAASTRPAAVAWAAAAGLNVALTLTGPELARSAHRLAALARAKGVDGVLIHSEDWAGEAYPHLYELAALLVPARTRVIADERHATTTPVGTAELAVRAARTPLDGLGGLARTGLELARRQRAITPPAARRPAGAVPAVLAVWPGGPGSVGGAISHMTGILSGFRGAGARVGLLAATPPAPQLAAVIDDCEIADPPPRSGRVTRDVASIALNAQLRRAGRRLAARLDPGLVYQRHAPFLLAGTDLADDLDVPFVLEWNASVVWTRAHWEQRVRVERVFEPLLAAFERRVVRRATLVAAVSDHAADMAVQAGGEPGRVLVVPNAADVAAIEPAPEREPADGTVTLGWIGSFGPWHGAPVLIRAMAKLPAPVRAVLIGAGPELPMCEALAAELGVTDRVEFTGSLAHDRALDRLRACDMLVSPHVPLPGTPFFGSPTKLFEYMALGLPIVASRLEQLGEVLTDGRTACLAAPDDPDDLAKAVLRVRELPDQGRALGRAARAEAERHHTWDQRAAAVLAALGT